MSIATANIAMKPKALLLIFGGMTLSFTLILGVMLAVVGPDHEPRRKSIRVRIVEETSEPRPATAPARPVLRQRLQQESETPTTESIAEKPPTLTSETLPTPVAQAPLTERQTPIAPNKLAMQQLGSLKKDLNRELQALKKDRNAMLKSLAQALMALPTAEIAQEITALDDRSATTVLRQFSPQVRGKVLSQLEPGRARKLKKRLN